MHMVMRFQRDARAYAIAHDKMDKEKVNETQMEEKPAKGWRGDRVAPGPPMRSPPPTPPPSPPSDIVRKAPGLIVLLIVKLAMLIIELIKLIFRLPGLIFKTIRALPNLIRTLPGLMIELFELLKWAVNKENRAKMHYAFFAKRHIRRRVTRTPLPLPDGFIAIPNFLVWPNPELALLALYGAGLANTCTRAVWLAGRSPLASFIGVIGLIVLTLFIAYEWYQVRSFNLRHADQMWESSEGYYQPDMSEITDPLMRCLVKLRLRTPALRFAGAFDAGSEDLIEPARSRRAIVVPFTWSNRRSIDAYQPRGSVWLSGVDAGCGRMGIYYQLLMFTVQVLFAFIAGLDAEGDPISGGGLTQAIFLISLQFGLGAYTLIASPAHDRIAGMFIGFEYLLSSLALILQLNAAWSRDWVLLMTSSRLLLAASCVHLFQVLYDAVVLPSLVMYFGKAVIRMERFGSDPSHQIAPSNTMVWTRSGKKRHLSRRMMPSMKHR